MLEKAYAKINLTLDILGTRADGYHEVSMIMQSIALHDDVFIEKSDNGIKLVVEGSDLPADENNLAYRAAKLMTDEYKIKNGAEIRLIKRIPMGAGLGGGSSDAAAVIRGMNKLFEIGLSDEKLQELGAKIGSDVSFCIKGGTNLATGRGEILQKLSDFPKMPLILAKPKFSVSTPWAYKSYDKMQKINRPNNNAMISALESGDIKKMFSSMGNVLEQPVAKEYPEINEYKKIMLDLGAVFTQMTGSGSVVFAFANDTQTAKKIADVMREKTSCEIFVTETIYSTM